MRKIWEEEQWKNKQRSLLNHNKLCPHTHIHRIEDEEADKRLMTAVEIERKNARTIDLLRTKDANIQKVIQNDLSNNF